MKGRVIGMKDTRSPRGQSKNKKVQKKSKLPLHLTLVIGAIGVVYGDIGTSPLYAVNTVFFGMGNTAATHNNILGVISLMFWLLTTVVAYKYIFFVL